MMRYGLPLILALLTACEPGKDLDSGLETGLDSGLEDLDGDGFSPPEDCDDSDPDIHPDAVEIYDGVDQDCSGVADDNLPEWGYVEDEEHVGPDRWPEFWPSCGGDRQSPVDIDDPVTEAALAPIEFHYSATAISIRNTGHSVQWAVDPGSSIRVDGVNWALEQLHFHAGAEHLLGGQQFPLEVHLVHRDDKGTAETADDELMVLSAIFQVGGDEHPYLAEMGWGQMPAEHGDTYEDTATFNPIRLFGSDDYDAPRSVRYEGSLTTPPCSEIVTWAFLDTSQGGGGPPLLPLSADQLQAFTDIYDANFREPQARNDREYLIDAP